MASDAKLRWGIIGPGRIAQAFAGGVAHSRTGRLLAIGTRDPAKAGLAEAFPGARIHAGYDALLADPEVEAVYIATPHPSHVHWGIRAAEAGKHVLCEKPMGVNAYDAMALVDAARRAGVFLAEGYMYRAHPQTKRLVELIRGGAIGDVRMIQASFGFAAGFNPDHRLFANDLAGGGILDVGGYPVSMARLIAGAASGKPFLDPVKVTGAGQLGRTGVDEWTAAVLHFPGGIVAQVATGVSLALENVVRVFGTAGRIEVASPWFCSGKEGGHSTIVITRPDGTAETVAIDEPGWLYAFEADAVGDAVAAGRHESAAMSLADTLGNLKAMDAWRAAIGLEYALETPARRTAPVDGRPLKAGAMRRIDLPGARRPASALALGAVGVQNISHAGLLFDRFFERGGNTFDTAWQYRNGDSDRLLGHWQASRGVRDEIVLIGKGAHSPLCYPDVIPRQLTDTLDRLQTGRLDLYLMHRDNPDIAVGEFVDVLDAEIRAGRIGSWGGSNWTRERLDEAIAYAEANGRHGPATVSNNFSLADMIQPVWAGCIASSDAEWRAWLRQRQMPLLAWSSQARGFFTDRGGRDRHADPELERCWYGETNFRRRDRAAELGARIGKSANQVALAYGLHQDFPILPLIGPLTLEELEDSLQALDIALTPEEVRWLEG
jgi:predicted dehydrogenase/aryl-alcohol dehydrogenase-like predicted oxidoreductase